MKLFWKALGDTLRADASLVSLTGHTASDPRIVRSSSVEPVKRTGLFFEEVFTFPFRGADTHKLLETSVDLRAVGMSDIQCADIQRAVSVKFENVDEKIAFIDITNSDVLCYRASITDISKVQFEPDLDLWESVIGVTFKWSYK